MNVCKILSLFFFLHSVGNNLVGLRKNILYTSMQNVDCRYCVVKFIEKMANQVVSFSKAALFQKVGTITSLMTN